LNAHNVSQSNDSKRPFVEQNLAGRRFRPGSSPSAAFRKQSPMTKPMSKFELIQKIADQHSLLKKDVKSVTESPASMGYKELKKNGALPLPGFAKFVVIKKRATKECAGINPFTKEPTVFKGSQPERLSGLVR
jgi:DNA-binding protein HU-beta